MDLLTFDISRSTWFAELTPGRVVLTRTLRAGCLLSGSFTVTECSGTHSLPLLLLLHVRNSPSPGEAVGLSLLVFCDLVTEEAFCFAGVISSISRLLGCVEPLLPFVDVVPFVRNIRGGRSPLYSDSDKWRERRGEKYFWCKIKIIKWPVIYDIHVLLVCSRSVLGLFSCLRSECLMSSLLSGVNRWPQRSSSECWRSAFGPLNWSSIWQK